MVVQVMGGGWRTYTLVHSIHLQKAKRHHPKRVFQILGREISSPIHTPFLHVSSIRFHLIPIECQYRSYGHLTLELWLFYNPLVHDYNTKVKNKFLHLLLGPLLHREERQSKLLWLRWVHMGFDMNSGA